MYEEAGNAPLLYIDRHLMHEVTSPQAFEGMALAGRSVRNKHSILATMDHCVPTKNRNLPIADPVAKKQIETMAENCSSNGLNLYEMENPNNGVIHIVVPEHGFVHPGMTVVCGDSHTATHGAFGALAFGIGTSEVEHVMVTQTLPQKKSRTMKIEVTGTLSPYCSAKDIALAIIGKIGTAGGTGYVVEFCGDAIKNLSMEGRMTLCNMTIEAGARAGMVAPDEKTFEYLYGREFAPAGDDWEQALNYWKSITSDKGAEYDRAVVLAAEEIAPQVTWGTSPEQVVGVDSCVPAADSFDNAIQQLACESAQAYMDLKAGARITEINIDYVFLGSCTNGRNEDFRSAAAVVKGSTVHKNVTAIAVPGSFLVKTRRK